MTSDFLTLPRDILIVISKILEVKDYVSLLKSCRYFSDIYLDDHIWNYLVMRDYPDIRDMKIDDLWRIVYKKRYQMEKFIITRAPKHTSICENVNKGDLVSLGDIIYIHIDDGVPIKNKNPRTLCRQLPVITEFPIDYWEEEPKLSKLIWFDAVPYVDQLVANTKIDTERRIITTNFVVNYCKFDIFMYDHQGYVTGYMLSEISEYRARRLRILYSSRLYETKHKLSKIFPDSYIHQYVNDPKRKNKLLILNPGISKYTEEETLEFLLEAERNNDMVAYLDRIKRTDFLDFLSSYWDDLVDRGGSKDVLKLLIEYQDFYLDVDDLLRLPLEYDDLFYLGLERVDLDFDYFNDHVIVDNIESLNDPRMLRRIERLVEDKKCDQHQRENMRKLLSENMLIKISK